MAKMQMNKMWASQCRELAHYQLPRLKQGLLVNATGSDAPGFSQLTFYLVLLQLSLIHWP